jgi:predicted O-methyltransferase YrrM
MKTAVCCAYFADGLVAQLVRELQPHADQIHLWALDDVQPDVAAWTRGSGRLLRIAAFNRLLTYAADADLVLFVDDDVRLPPGFLPLYVSLIRRLGVRLAQPALTADSYHSHPITLERPGCWARLTTYVESGPVVSMTRELLDLLTPFPEDSPMGWGLDVQWAAVARSRGWDLAILDACAVEHTHRPVGQRYDPWEASAAMDAFLKARGLTWSDPEVLREFHRLYDRAEDYLAAFPAPAEALAHGDRTDIARDLPLLWAAASLVRPGLVLELGTRGGTSTRTLVHAVAPWEGTVVTADPFDARPYLDGLPCQFVHMDGEELFRAWTTPLPFLFFDTDPHSYRQTRRWLDTWVKTWLTDGGVAVFHDVVTDRPGVRVAEAVRDWLREQPANWLWQEFPGTSGLGLLWRMEDPRRFAGLAAPSRRPVSVSPSP